MSEGPAKAKGLTVAPANPLRDIALVAGEGFEPSTFGLCLPLQLSLSG